MMTEEELRLYSSLGQALGGKVIDPKHAPAHLQELRERQLREWVRENWRHRKAFRSWIHGYVRRWADEKDKSDQGEVASDADQPAEVVAG